MSDTDDAPKLEPEWRPTHLLKDIKAGDGSVQLLISTKDSVYDAENIEAGTNSWQVIGSWEESSLVELTKILSTRATEAVATTSSDSKFGSKYGGGQKLGVSTRSSKERESS